MAGGMLLACKLGELSNVCPDERRPKTTNCVGENVFSRKTWEWTEEPLSRLDSSTGTKHIVI